MEFGKGVLGGGECWGCEGGDWDVSVGGGEIN